MELKVTKNSGIDPRLSVGPAAAVVKERFTGIYVTYTINRKYEMYSDEAKEVALRLKESVDELIDHIGQFLIFEKGTINDIVALDTVSSVEQGEKTGHVHTHFALKIRHNAHIKVDLQQMKGFLNFANETSGYWNLKFFYQGNALDKYIMKTLTPAE